MTGSINNNMDGIKNGTDEMRTRIINMDKAGVE